MAYNVWLKNNISIMTAAKAWRISSGGNDVSEASGAAKKHGNERRK